MDTKFYYNYSLNLCAEEEWVVEYLLINDVLSDDREEILKGLHTCREFRGWYECEVSNTIADAMECGGAI